MVVLNKQINKTSSRSRRFSAYLIDGTILAASSLILASLSRYTHNGFFLLASYIIPALYFILFLISQWSATPGQRVLGIRVRDSVSGGRISATQSILRFCVFEGMLALSALLSIHFLSMMVKNESQKSTAVYISAKPTAGYNNRDEYIDSEELEQEHTSNDIGSMNVTVYEVKLKPIGYLVGRDKQMAHEQQLLTRSSNHFISIFSMTIYLILLVVPTFMNNRKQTLYDMASGTCVIKNK